MVEPGHPVPDLAPPGEPLRHESGGTFDDDTLGTEDPSNIGQVGAGAGGGGDLDYLRDIAALHSLCNRALESDGATWDAIRRWLRTHGADEAQRGAEYLGEFNTTALHLACRNCPPADVVDVLLSASPDTVRWEDAFGWLPLHYACANGASEEVLRILAEAYPDSKTATDRRGRTPLHFAFSDRPLDRLATPAMVVLLRSTGAAVCADENGMLPLHYACAYGASEEALKILMEGNMDSITATDRWGRTPLHFALGNADRPFSPAVVQLLLSQNRKVVNEVNNNGQLPLHLLAMRAQTLKEAQQRERANALRCLLLYIAAEPRPTADFLTALQALPGWLRASAVVHPTVQNLLNDKISQRFPTAFISLDFYMIFVVIVVYYVMAKKAVQQRFDESGSGPRTDIPQEEKALPFIDVFGLYLGVFWFLLREALQIQSLLSLGLFSTYVNDLSNLIDWIFIILSLCGAILMNTGGGDDYVFRALAAVSVFFLWIKFLSFLKSMSIHFAVFIRGMIFVIEKLVVFTMSVVIILIMFAQAFYTLFRESEYCNCEPSDPECGTKEGEIRPFCDRFGRSFIKVYTMFLGEVDDTLFQDWFQTLLFALFMFLAVILLANVLIAIVTDSYGVISEKAAIVFWSNRLDFIAEMDAIAAGPLGKVPIGLCCIGKEQDGSGWKKLMDLFEDDVNEQSPGPVEFWCYIIIRLFVAIFIIPTWLIAGLLSAGLLWPPQVRKNLFVFAKHNLSEENDAEQRTKEINELKTFLKEHQGDISSDLSANRKDLVSMKLQLAEMKSGVTNQMTEIKEMMNELFELQSTLGA